MSAQPFPVLGPSVGAILFAAVGVSLTFFPGWVQRFVARFVERSRGALMYRVVGVSLLAFAAIMACVRVPVYFVVALAAGGAAYAFWPRSVNRLSSAHVRSRIYLWELRLMGLSSLAAAALIAYLLLSASRGR